ncbi:substrate-binding periplasmic protein [Chitinimonas lacunae]|uniref:Substrate-binding periplasmic protein n=1 Tax=Chitinimonas lacunae TaxID=1963018 RepID=A0ABV8MPY7_9NEIS
MKTLLILLPSLSAVHATPLLLASAEFPPFREKIGDSYRGADYEIVTQVFERLGYQVTVQFYPLQRALKLAEKGAVAGFFTLTRNPERERIFLFTAPVSTVTDVLFKRRLDTLTWQNLSDLRGYRVSASEGYNYAPGLLANLKLGGAQLSMVVGEKPEYEHLRQLSAGLVDLAICEVSVCSSLIQQHPDRFGHIDYIDRPLGETRSFHLGISRKHPNAEGLVAAFDAELAKFAAEGKRAEIFKRYGMRVSLDKAGSRSAAQQ